MLIMSEKVMILCLLLFTGSTKSIEPRDLADEAQEQLDQLKSIIQGDILVAHNDLQASYSDFGQNSINVAGEGMIAMHQEEDTINQQLTTIKDLAQGAGKDISSCTDIREEVLNRLTFQYGEDLGYCVGGVSYSAMLTVENSKYFVDIVINKVHDLEFQLRQCRDDLLCISPLVTQIELQKIDLPQNIKREVQHCEGLLETLKLSTTECADDKVAQYIAEANSILKEITECVDGILS